MGQIRMDCIKPQANKHFLRLEYKKQLNLFKHVTFDFAALLITYRPPPFFFCHFLVFIITIEGFFLKIRFKEKEEKKVKKCRLLDTVKQYFSHCVLMLKIFRGINVSRFADFLYKIVFKSCVYKMFCGFNFSLFLKNSRNWCSTVHAISILERVNFDLSNICS